MGARCGSRHAAQPAHQAQLRTKARAMGDVAEATRPSKPASHHRRSSRATKPMATHVSTMPSAYTRLKAKVPGNTANSSVARMAPSRPANRRTSTPMATTAVSPVTTLMTTPTASGDSVPSKDSQRTASGNTGKKAAVLAVTCPCAMGRCCGHPCSAARRNQVPSHRASSPARLLSSTRSATKRPARLKSRTSR